MSSHTAQTELKLIGKLILEGDLDCRTGLHIGAGKGSLEIGGADNPVVKDAFGLPYVPGSTLRGRLRSLLEQASGLAVPSELVYLSRRKGQEVRMTTSASCSAGIRDVWIASPAASRSKEPRPVRRGSPSTMPLWFLKASPPRCGRTSTTS